MVHSTSGNNDYDALPEPIKMLFSLKEYLWLGETERARVIERECYPDYEVVE